MGHVNEGGMHFIHFGKGIEKKEFEIDNNYASSKKKGIDRPQTIVYKGKTYEVVGVKPVKDNYQNKKISPNKIKDCKFAIGYRLFCDTTGKENICVLLMHETTTGFTKHSSQTYVLRTFHSFKTVDALVEVIIKKDHSMPVSSFAEKTLVKIDKNACWVAACIPISETKKLIKNETAKYRIDYSVRIDRGIEVRYQLLIAEEEFNYAFTEGDNLWKKIRHRDVEKLFSLSGFNNYCERF